MAKVLLALVLIAYQSSSIAEVNNWLSSNVRLAIDLATRRTQSLTSDDYPWAHFIGLDLHKVFSGERGDIGTLVFQPYLTRLSNVA